MSRCASIAAASPLTAHARFRTGQLERLWRRNDVAVREKALWRLLYETAARASKILSLNVEDIDRDNREPSCAARAATSTFCTSRPDQPG